MWLGQQSCYLKTPLQTFGAATAIALTAPHLCITFVTAADVLGGRAGMEREGAWLEAGT